MGFVFSLAPGVRWSTRPPGRPYPRPAFRVWVPIPQLGRDFPREDTPSPAVPGSLSRGDGAYRPYGTSRQLTAQMALESQNHSTDVTRDATDNHCDKGRYSGGPVGKHDITPLRKLEKRAHQAKAGDFSEEPQKLILNLHGDPCMALWA